MTWGLAGALVAALAYGAGAIERVNLICGPGNAWVSAAKALVASTPGGPGIDLPAGPSELMVIADSSADAATVIAIEVILILFTRPPFSPQRRFCPCDPRRST